MKTFQQLRGPKVLVQYYPRSPSEDGQYRSQTGRFSESFLQHRVKLVPKDTSKSKKMKITLLSNLVIIENLISEDKISN